MGRQRGQVFILHSSVNSVKNEDPTPLFHYYRGGANAIMPRRSEVSEIMEYKMNIAIEVAVRPSTSSTERGRLLQNLANRLLKAQQYRVVDEVRLTGIEVDLLCEAFDGTEKIFVECKAWREALKADAFTKLLGNLELHDADSGWMIATGPLGKDAKGLLEKWKNKPRERRRRLRTFTATEIVRALTDTATICDPSVVLRESESETDAPLLLISDVGEYWVVPVVPATGGVARQALVYSAKSGEPINDYGVLSDIKETDCTFSDLQLILPGDK
ncbi:hypothetical protein LCGC14_2779990, partial [marine sediment metagenome]